MVLLTLYKDRFTGSQYNNSSTIHLYIGTIDADGIIHQIRIGGYISNLRICKGHAVYTGNFTVPTRELEVHTKPPKGVVFPAADNRTVLLACQDLHTDPLSRSNRKTYNYWCRKSWWMFTGQNLVTNGDFVTDVSGWTALNSTTSVSSGQVTITNSGSANGRLTSTALVITVVGARYALKYRAITSGGSYRAR